MTVVGEVQEQRVLRAEVLIAARAMQSAMSLVKPLLGEGEVIRGQVVIGTVRRPATSVEPGRHDAEGGGYGSSTRVGVAPEKFVSAAVENNADVIALSALLTTTMPSMRTPWTLTEAGPRARSRSSSAARRYPKLRR